MASVNFIPASSMDDYIKRGGGVLLTARALKVSVEEVERWRREGVDDPMAGALTHYVYLGKKAEGRRPRPDTVTLAELAMAIERVGGVAQLARALSLSRMSVWRYLHGQSKPDDASATTIRAIVAGEAIEAPKRWGSEEVVGAIERAGGSRAVARALGVALRTVTAWRRGESAPSSARLAELLRLPAHAPTKPGRPVSNYSPVPADVLVWLVEEFGSARALARALGVSPGVLARLQKSGVTSGHVAQAIDDLFVQGTPEASCPHSGRAEAQG